MQKSKTSGRPQIMIIKCMLRHLMSIGSKNIDISKILKVGRNLVARCVKFHGLTNTLTKPEDDMKYHKFCVKFIKFKKALDPAASQAISERKGQHSSK